MLPVCYLPLRIRFLIGRWIGWIGMHVAGNRRHIVHTNLKLCFPQLSERELNRLTADNFTSTGISLVETAVVWFRHASSFTDVVDFHGLEILDEAKAKGNGVMLIGSHLSTLDFCGAVMGTACEVDVMYRPSKNKLIDAIMTRGRMRHFPSAIERQDIRQVIRRLREGAVVWYGPDQDYGRKHSIFAPFFDIPAATITATARIAAMTKAEIVLYSHYRHLDTGRYSIHLKQLPVPFPTGDAVEDGTIINHAVETAIRHAPEQYWWLHRRFKTRPEGESRPYARSS